MATLHRDAWIEKTARKPAVRAKKVIATTACAPSKRAAVVNVRETHSSAWLSHAEHGAYRTLANDVVRVSSFVALYRLSGIDRITLIKSGISPIAVGDMAKAMGVARETIAKTLGLSISTIDRKVKEAQPLSRDQGESVVGLAKLIGQVQAMVEQSGDPEGFDAAQWVAQWLNRPLPALGNRPPSAFMDTAEGREVISDLVAMSQSGAYA